MGHRLAAGEEKERRYREDIIQTNNLQVLQNGRGIEKESEHVAGVVEREEKREHRQQSPGRGE